MKHLDFSVVEKTLLGQMDDPVYDQQSEHSPNQGSHSHEQASRAHHKNLVLNQTSLPQDIQFSIDSVDSIGNQSADYGQKRAGP